MLQTLVANPTAPDLGFEFPIGASSRVGMTEYKVKFEVFEGPLDLLLYLIQKEEVDIYEVNLTKLATQFLEYIEVMRMLDLDIAGEFLVMAATLMYIKSRELLPKDQQVTPEDEEPGEDPRWELIRQLVEYKKFKDAAARLQELEIRQENTYPRLPAKPEFGVDDAVTRGSVSLFDLLNAVNSVLKRVDQREVPRDIFEDKWTVSEKIEHLLQMVTEGATIIFFQLFVGATSRSEVVVTFLALLELIRLRQLVAVQKEPFGEIQVSRAPRVPILSSQHQEARSGSERPPAPDEPEQGPATPVMTSAEAPPATTAASSGAACSSAPDRGAVRTPPST